MHALFSHRFIGCCALLFCHWHTLTGAVVTGHFLNFISEAGFAVHAPHYYLDGKEDKYAFVPDDSGQFRVEVPLPGPQIVFIAVNNDRLPVFLEPDDSLHVRSIFMQFPLNVDFSGKAGKNNKVLHDYFHLVNKDFSDFNNVRYKVGQNWFSAEFDMQSYIDRLGQEQFRKFMQEQRQKQTAFFEEQTRNHENSLSAEFIKWLEADIIYDWAYNLLLYGQVNERRLNLTPEFFGFTDEVSYYCQCLYNESYRQYLQLLLARQIAKTGRSDVFYAQQYQLAGDFLEGEPLAYIRSEIIFQAFNTERYREILPAYLDFLKTNAYPVFEPKVTDLYAKVVRNAPGITAPDFSGKDLFGQFLDLQQFKGKIVYLNFWASWCGACLQKMSAFDQFAGELGAHGVEIINISIDSDQEKWQAALRRHPYRGRHLRNPTTNGDDVARTYGVEAIPQYFIIGKDGTFADKPTHHQPDDIRNQLLSLSKTY